MAGLTDFLTSAGGGDIVGTGLSLVGGALGGIAGSNAAEEQYKRRTYSRRYR